LIDIFTDIYEETGTFPDDRDEYTQLAIVNKHLNSCLTILGRKVGNGGRIGLDQCYFTHVDSPELFHLKHAGEGYVTLATPWNKCVGAGRKDGAAVWTGDWCNSHSHQFSIEVRKNEAQMLFVNRESGNYLTAMKPEEPLQSHGYRSHDPHQMWSICDPSGKKCWPKVIKKEESETRLEDDASFTNATTNTIWKSRN